MPGDGHPITIVFTDVQGSTQLRARHGDRIADEILHDHEEIVRQAIGAHGGVEAGFLGDGFMAAFPSPAAGLSCAIAVQRALQRYGREHPDRRTRRYYSITAAGRRERRRLEKELEPFLDSVIRSVTLIKRELYG